MSLKDAAIPTREDAKRIWRGKFRTQSFWLRLSASTRPHAKRVVFETGPFDVVYHALMAEGAPAIVH